MSKAGLRNRQPQLLRNLIKHKLVGLSASMIAITIIAATGIRDAMIAADLPIVKSAALGASLNVPWSQPVKVVDPLKEII